MAGRLELVRWNVTSGSSVQSRAAVVVRSGDHQWEARGEAHGPIAALYRAVDASLAEVLGGHPRLLAYDAHAVSESPDAEAVVTVAIAPPGGLGADLGEERYAGEARDENVIAASILAYVAAIDSLLADERWAGATDARGNRRAAETEAAAARRRARGATLDEDAAEDAAPDWFEP